MSIRPGEFRTALCRPACFRSPKPPTGSWLLSLPGDLYRFDGVQFVRWPVPSGPSGKVFADSAGGLWVTARELVHLKSGIVASQFELEGTHGFQSISEDPEGTVWVGLRRQDAPLCNASDHGSSVSERTMGFRFATSMRCCPMAAVAYGWEDRRPSFAGTAVGCRSVFRQGFDNESGPHPRRNAVGGPVRGRTRAGASSAARRGAENIRHAALRWKHSQRHQPDGGS